MSKVVIIGGGPSAKHVADKLKKAKDVHITVVQANRFVEWALAMPTVLCKPQLHTKALAANPKTYQTAGVSYVYGPATSVDTEAKTVTVKSESGENATVSFDALIVCTGMDLPVFTPELGTSLADRQAEVRKISDAIAKANSVAVMGGGVVGVEFAGTLKATFPSKKVVLACRDGLLKSFPEERRTKMAAVLAKRGIEVVSGAGVDVPSELRLEPGTMKVGDESVSYDVFVPAYSRGPGTKFLAQTDLLDGRGYIKVNEFLQSKTSPSIFAVGVGDVNEPCVNFAKLDAQWSTVSRNVVAQLQGKPLKAHQEGAKFMKNPPLLLVSGGAGGWAGFDFKEMPGMLKCCCCYGKGGFPFCPPPCCWCCCGPRCCGYCFGPPEGEGTARAIGAMPFKTFGFHFKGIADVPAQQTM